MNENLNGAWEPNHHGPRIEIDGDKLVRLWRGKPVLKTRFTLKKKADKTVLELKDTAMRYSRDSAPYAEMKECYVSDGVMYITDYFPISGESRDTMRPTDNNRYGNFELLGPEVLETLGGVWEGGGFKIKLEGNKLSIGMGEGFGRETEVIAVRSRGDGRVYIIDSDPSSDSVAMFGRIRLEGECLCTYILVTDITPPEIRFTRVSGK